MNELFRVVLSADFQGSIVILAVLALRLILRKAPKKYTCLLWILVGLRLLVPLEIESDFSLQPEPERVTLQQWQNLRENAPEEQTVGRSEVVVPEVPAANETPVHPAEPDAPAAEPEMPVQIAQSEDTNVEVSFEINWSELVPYLWLLGVAGLTGYSLVSYLRLKRRVREAVRLTDDVWECDRIGTAFILGYLRPRIYLPVGLPVTSRRFILNHEDAHLERGDHWVKLVGFAALVVHWFNPLVWAAYILLCRDIEMACDERVVRNMPLEERKCYSAALLLCSTNRRSIVACPVAFGEIDVKGRIRNVLNYRKPAFWLTVIAVIAIVFVAVCFLTSPVETIDPLTLENWGITMTAEESSSTGVTVAFSLPEKAEGNFVFNFSNWALQAESDGEWVDVTMLPQEEPDIPWNGHVSMLFPNDEVQRIALDWTTVYGEMPPGRYRVRGTVMLVQDTCGYNQDFYAQFRIRNSDKEQDAWTEEDQSALEKIEAVLDEIQSKDYYHMTQQRQFEGDFVFGSPEAEIWRVGDTWLRIRTEDGIGFLDGVPISGVESSMAYDGSFFTGNGITWETAEAYEVGFLDPWLYTFRLEDQEIKSVRIEETEDNYSVLLNLQIVDDTDDTAYSEVESLEFVFGSSGEFRYAEEITYYENKNDPAMYSTVTVTTTVHETEESAIAAVIEAAYCEAMGEGGIPSLAYTRSATTHRVAEPYSPTITFDEKTEDYESDWAIYHFDTAIPEEERDECVYCSDAILSRLGLGSKPDILVVDGYEGAWTDGIWYYLGADDFHSADYGAKLITLACGGYANYGAAYGLAEYIAWQENWRTVDYDYGILEGTDARDLNWLCFREGFVSEEEIRENEKLARTFAYVTIREKGLESYVQLLKQSGDVSTAAEFSQVLSDWYKVEERLDYQPTEILYAIGGEYHDYLVKCRYATFYMPKDWSAGRFSELAPDENYLHQNYSDVKFCFETNVFQMQAIQEYYGVSKDTSILQIEFMNGLGATWTARNYIQLSCLDYLCTDYIHYITDSENMVRTYDGKLAEMLWYGMAEYVARLVPNVYEDATHIYSVEHGNQGYSNLQGDWFPYWQEIVDGETDPDVLWRKRWDFICYYFGNENEMMMSFTAYLIDELGFETVCDWFYKTGNEVPDIDFAQWAEKWNKWLEKTYGMYPKYEG